MEKLGHFRIVYFYLCWNNKNYLWREKNPFPLYSAIVLIPWKSSGVACEHFIVFGKCFSLRSDERFISLKQTIEKSTDNMIKYHKWCCNFRWRDSKIVWAVLYFRSTLKKWLCFENKFFISFLLIFFFLFIKWT